MVVIKVLLCLYLQYVIVVHGAGLFGLLYGLPRLCLCRCGISRGYFGSTRTGRNTRDSSVIPHEYPWLVAINIGPQVVAGSLISDRHVLTAASAIYGLTPNHITVTLGAHDRCSIGGSALNVSVQATILHPGFSPTSLDNDLALIRLKHIVTFSRYITPICLPVLGSRDSEQLTWTVGWPQNNTTCTPHVAVLPTVPTAACQNEVDNKLKSYEKGCLGPLGVKSVLCKSDVGSPVMTRWSSSAPLRLIGVISSSSCDDSTTIPPLFTRIVDHVGWIYEYVRRDCLCF